MRQLSTVLFVLTAMAWAGCINQQEVQFAGDICELFHAKDCRISHGYTADSGTGTKKSIIISIEGVDGLYSYKNKEYITSIAALSYYNSQKAEDLADFEEIKVTASSGSSSYEKSYALRDMLPVNSALETVRTYFQMLKEDRIAELSSLVDSEHIDDSSMTVIMNGMLLLDSVYGQQQSAAILGFKLDHTSKGGEPVVVCWSEAINGENSATRFQLYVNRDTKKIIYIGVNDFD